ncbi:MAG: adenosine deaminase, partial [Candidatus Eremiobacteraeota bacterium]|nr:adenosine deaminase [Candidatus Eremiobacteraeota bacterium]
DFESFLTAFIQVVKTLRTPQDLAEISADYLEKSAQEGVRHVEFLFSPATLRHFFPDINLSAIVAAIHAECLRARAEHNVSSVMIFDIVRNLGEQAALADLDLAVRSKGYGVVGVGLGGDERRFPARDFSSVFDQAKRLGLRRTAHAGEADGSQSIVDAITILHAERLGHAVAAAGEEDVLKLIRERAVTVDACLTSNAVTRAWNGKGAHPLVEFLKAGISVTLNSDDPAFFRASLLDEYSLAAEQGLGRTDLAQLARNSFQSSFASDKEKRTWLRELDAYMETARG